MAIAKVPDDLFKICQTCGEKFHPNTYRQRNCGKTRTKTCPICGKDFTYTCTPEGSKKKTCSRKCADQFAEQVRESKSSEVKRACEYCGKLFTPKTKFDRYCSGPHYKKCEVCGKEFEFDILYYKGIKTCSKECRYKLATDNRDIPTMVQNLESTMLVKYGVKHAMNIPGVVDKIKETNKARYGSDWYTQTDEYKQSVEKTSLANYGVKHFLSSEEVKSKRRDTCNEKYGVDNVSKSTEIKERIKETYVKKFGLENVSQTRIGNISEWVQFKADPKKYLETTFDNAPTIQDLCLYFGCCSASLYNALKDVDISNLIKHTNSNVESEIVDYLKSISSDFKVVRNCRSIIAPYEIDIYLPELKLGIECDPTVTHNSSVSDPWGQPPKDSKYHQMKTDMCESHGVRLIHLFGYEWNHKRAIIESILRNVLGKNDRRIYARKCELREVSYTGSKVFLIANHRQGFANSSVRLGLYYQNELVSLMTFGKIRRTIGTNKDVDGWELIRFCNTLNTSVVGGASRLFKHFVDTYHPEVVLSFSDRAHTTGNLYQTLGFTEKSRSDPGYVWVDELTDVAYNRVNAQKQNLKKFLNDDNIDLTKTEAQIMEEHGFVRVYDSGVITWQWNKPMK